MPLKHTVVHMHTQLFLSIKEAFFNFLGKIYNHKETYILNCKY